MGADDDGQTGPFDWDALLDHLLEGRVVPIVGRDLLRTGPDEGDLLEPWLAGRVAATLGIEAPPDANLASVAFEYVRQGNSRAKVYRAIQGVLRKEASSLPVPRAIEQLAEIRPFDLYVTTTCDSMMYQALEAARGAARQLAYAVRTSESVQDIGLLGQGPSEPTVYHLLGKAESIPSYVVTEEDLVEFLHALQTENRPRNLISRLMQSSVLFLGCGFPEWLMRVFLRIVKDQPFSRRETEEFLVDHEVSATPDLVMFLSKYDAQVYPGGDAPAFVAELHRRWSESLPDAPEPAPVAPATTEAGPVGPIFLSYASEDRAVVDRFASRLRAAGLELWFDDRTLELGDPWCRKIEQGIEKCSMFVPFISRNTEARDKSYFHYEWALAEKVHLRFAQHRKFFWPVFVDDVSVDSLHVPECFPAIHAVRLENGEAPDSLVDALCEEVLRRKGLRA